jgi:flagellar biosynthesis component FlhA
MHYVEFIGFTLDVIGKLLIAYTAIRVHFRVWKEHKIDEYIFKEMKHERVYGIIGIILIILGYILQIPGKFF